MKVRTSWKIEFECLEEVDKLPTDEVKKELNEAIEAAKKQVADDIGLTDMKKAGVLVKDKISIDVSFEE